VESLLRVTQGEQEVLRRHGEIVSTAERFVSSTARADATTR
jgi:hypothetical protein